MLKHLQRTAGEAKGTHWQEERSKGREHAAVLSA
jgi:hypothetical protein